MDQKWQTVRKETEDNLDSFYQISCKKISGVAKNGKDLKSLLAHYPDTDEVLQYFKVI